MNYLIVACKPTVDGSPFEVIRDPMRNLFEANEAMKGYRALGYAAVALEPVEETLRKRKGKEDEKAKDKPSDGGTYPATENSNARRTREGTSA